MKEVGRNKIFYNVGCCRNCIYSIYYHGIIQEYSWKCTRFPTWIELRDIDAHWCGEWKLDE